SASRRLPAALRESGLSPGGASARPSSALRESGRTPGADSGRRTGTLAATRWGASQRVLLLAVAALLACATIVAAVVGLHRSSKPRTPVDPSKNAPALPSR